MSDDLSKRFIGYFYQTPSVILLPYHKDAFPKDFLSGIYGQMEEDGLLDRVFCGMPGLTRERCVAYLSKCPVVIYAVKPDTCIGFGWISESQGEDGCRKASFGFSFFKKYHGTQLVRDLCWLSLRWWYEELNIEILYTTSLKTNRMAVNFSRIFGFKSIGDLPMFFEQDGRLVDGHLMYLKRDDFDLGFREWEKTRKDVEDAGIERDTVLIL